MCLKYVRIIAVLPVPIIPIVNPILLLRIGINTEVEPSATIWCHTSGHGEERSLPWGPFVGLLVLAMFVHVPLFLLETRLFDGRTVYVTLLQLPDVRSQSWVGGTERFAHAVLQFVQRHGEDGELVVLKRHNFQVLFINHKGDAHVVGLSWPGFDLPDESGVWYVYRVGRIAFGHGSVWTFGRGWLVEALKLTLCTSYFKWGSTYFLCGWVRLKGRHFETIELLQHLPGCVGGWIVGTFAAVTVFLELVWVLFGIFFVSRVVHAFYELGPLAVHVLKFMFAENWWSVLVLPQRWQYVQLVSNVAFDFMKIPRVRAGRFKGQVGFVTCGWIGDLHVSTLFHP